MIKHYVYRIDDPITKEFYFGSRSCLCDIKDDIYMGSYKTWNPDDKSRLVKTILKSNFRKRETCIKYEASLIKENIDNKLNRNYHIPNIGFHTYGKIHTLETRQLLREISLGHHGYWNGKTLSISTKLKISKANYGKKRSSVVKNKMSIVRTGIGNNMYGKHHNDSTKQKISKSKTGKTVTSNYKPIIQECINGIFIREWDSATTAARVLELHNGHIGQCCLGNRKTHGGFIWKYKEEIV